MIKKFLYIFIPFLAVLFMSHNAVAVTTNFDLSGYTLVDSFSPTFSCEFKTASTVNGVYSCNLNNNDALRSILSTNSYELKTNDIVTFDLVLYSQSTDPLVDYVSIQHLAPGLSNVLLDFSLVSNSDSLNIDVETDDLSPTSFYYDIRSGYFINRVYSVSYLSRSNGSKKLGFSTGSNDFILYMQDVKAIPALLSPLKVRVLNFKIWRKGQSQVNQEQEEATQDAANNSATSGSNSSSNSQTATSSLLSVIASGVGAITSASPTNCKINGNMGNLNVGNIDLCANPVPTFMALIGSIIAVLVVLPLVILLFNRFISIIRSFQR